MTTPDVVGPIPAYRLWTVDGDGSLYSLFGDGLAGMWRQEMTARCNILDSFYRALERFERLDEHGVTVTVDPAPQQNCVCGLYALSTLRRAYQKRFRYGAFFDLPDLVIGTVELWGRVQQHTWGYRAQHARITGLVQPRFRKPKPALVYASERYGVPLITGPASREHMERRLRT